MNDELNRVAKRNRQLIYISDDIKEALRDRKESLSTAMSVIAERYTGTIKRAGKTPMMDFDAKLYLNVLREVGHPLSSREIAAFPSMCEDWISRNRSFPEQPAKTAITILKNSPFIDLMSLVDWLERYK